MSDQIFVHNGLPYQKTWWEGGKEGCMYMHHCVHPCTANPCVSFCYTYCFFLSFLYCFFFHCSSDGVHYTFHVHVLYHEHGSHMTTMSILSLEHDLLLSICMKKQAS